MKKILAIVLASVMVLSLAACGAKNATPEQKEAVSEAVSEKAAEVKEAVEEKVEVAQEVKEAAKANKVGVSMPTKDLQRWNQDGENMRSSLKLLATK